MTRYTSATDADRRAMLDAIGVGSIDELFAEIPAELRLDRPLDLPAGQVGDRGLRPPRGARRAKRARRGRDKLPGAGMYDHYVPAIVNEITSRSEFLTPYTPYQPEISQGGLQVMFEFQTADLGAPRRIAAFETGRPVSSDIAVWNSNITCRPPCEISA